jgi:glyoxylase-like metal-dependent hydrolase (beta-lactamase superfamily II)
MIPFENVKVLIPGFHAKNEEGQLRLFSTVTLIKSDKNIIVDTGSFLEKDRIVEELKKENLTPKDIDIVVLTHLHLDHIVNTYLFENAKIFCKFKGQTGYPGQFHTPKLGLAQRTDIKENVKLAEDVEFLETPGHTEDMVSVVVNTSEGKIVVAGDALADEKMTNLENKPPVMILSSEADYDNSRKKILEIADYIIPGHGDMFKVEKN